MTFLLLIASTYPDGTSHIFRKGFHRHTLFVAVGNAGELTSDLGAGIGGLGEIERIRKVDIHGLAMEDKIARKMRRHDQKIGHDYCHGGKNNQGFYDQHVQAVVNGSKEQDVWNDKLLSDNEPFATATECKTRAAVNCCLTQRKHLSSFL